MISEDDDVSDDNREIMSMILSDQQNTDADVMFDAFVDDMYNTDGNTIADNIASVQTSPNYDNTAPASVPASCPAPACPDDDNVTVDNIISVPFIDNVPDLDDDGNAVPASFCCPECPGFSLEEKKHPQNHIKTSLGTISVWHCSNVSEAVREHPTTGNKEFRLSTDEKWKRCDNFLRGPAIGGKPNWIVERTKLMKKMFFLKEAGKTKRKGILGTNCKNCLDQVTKDPGLFLLCPKCRNLINQERHEVSLYFSPQHLIYLSQKTRQQLFAHLRLKKS